MVQEKQIVIVGGGIAGLTTAFYLQREIKNKGLPYRIKLIEASDRLGGKIRTVKMEGYVIEQGPDCFLKRKQSAAKLVKEVGLERELIENSTGQSYILVNNKLHEMPSGSFMGIPTEIRPFLFSSLFSFKGKLRAAYDFILPREEKVSDQSLGKFLRRRFGDELVENLVEPLLSGIYAGDIDELSLMATFPNLYQFEQKHRSLVKGIQASVPKRMKPTQEKPSMFFSLKNGLQSLVEAIEEQLEEGIVTKGTLVDQIKFESDKYHLYLDKGEIIQADTVVIATPFNATRHMLRDYTFATILDEMKATSVANVTLAFNASALRKDINGTGFVVSRNSGYRITACTWTHKKWPKTRAPEGKVLLRCYVGRPGDEEVVQLSDEEIINIARKDLNKIMSIDEKPEFSVVARWKNAMPQYSIGHKGRMSKLTEEMKGTLPGVFLAGGSYNGLGIPDCIDQGEAAALNVLQFL